jgi:hypothetical protein
VTHDTFLGPHYADIEGTNPVTGVVELVEGISRKASEGFSD